MGPKPAKCGVCGQPPKYRCSACPVRYCSVACYKTHKQDSCVAQPSEAAEAPAPSLEPSTTKPEAPPQQPESKPEPEAEDRPLRPLTDLKWPPEPDPMVFTDPLRRDDPKPLRHAELERVATSTPLRHLLASPVLTRILAVLDTLPSNARHATLARLLGVDNESLSRPAAAATLDRGSPPPLGELLAAAAGPREARSSWDAEGWWLGRGDERVWISKAEEQLVRQWAGVVVREIDGEGVDGEGAWGSGELAWEI